MKRILQVLCQKPGGTGSGTFLLALYEEAKKKGYNQAVIAGISQNERGIYDNLLENASFYPVQFDSELLPFHVVGMSDVMPYPSIRYCNLTEKMFDQWCRAFQDVLKKAVDSFQPDLILSHHLWLLTALTRKTIRDIPVFGICHSTCLRQLKLAPRFSSMVFHWCRKLDGIFALHDYQKEDIFRSYGIDKNRIAVTGAGYPTHIFYPQQGKVLGETVKIVYAGKLSFSKGVLSLIKAYKKLYQKGFPVELHLIGAGALPDERKIRETAQKAGGKIVFHGAVNQRDLGSIFRASDILVLPSFYEGLPLVVIEALASGLRVVTTNLPGLKEYIGHSLNNSRLISYVELPRCEQVDVPVLEELPNFEERLAQALIGQINALSDLFLWQQEEVIEAIAAMSWEGVFKKMEDFYTKILLERYGQ